MLLDGKRILVTGVLNDASIAFSVARQKRAAKVAIALIVPTEHIVQMLSMRNAIEM